jgi:hypothetical protein
VAKVNPSGTALVYAGFLGGSGDDWGYGIAVDSSGNAYVTGGTGSSDFPAVVGPDLSYNGYGYDAFVAKVNPSGTALVYAGFLGGSGDDWGLWHRRGLLRQRLRHGLYQFQRLPGGCGAGH